MRGPVAVRRVVEDALAAFVAIVLAATEALEFQIALSARDSKRQAELPKVRRARIVYLVPSPLTCKVGILPGYISERKLPEHSGTDHFAPNTSVRAK